MRLLIIGFCLLVFQLRGQDSIRTGSLDATFFKGNILSHAEDINHLITGHPNGAVISYNFKTNGNADWKKAYNFPEYGFSFLYQDFQNQYLGENYAIGAHFNFYFFKRNLMFRVSQGIAMTTNPYDSQTNYKNNAFGSRFLSSNYFILQYKKEHLFDRVGFQTGLIFTHFSNGRTKSPNKGINTLAISVGLNYNLDEPLIYPTSDSIAKFTEPIKYNISLKTGVNESPVVGLGQEPFLHMGFYVDKRISLKSAFQAGAELFITPSIQEYIKYRSVAFPELEPVDPDTDYKRVAVFVGYELFVNKISFEFQLGAYVYRPFDEDMPIYERLGMKYYFTKKVFSSLSLKTHGSKAEAIEWGIGVRL